MRSIGAQGVTDIQFSLLEKGDNILDESREREILKSDESCNSNPKSEIANWTVWAQSNLRFLNFGFEMQDPSDLKFSRLVSV